jgi:hypothetical protein
MDKEMILKIGVIGGILIAILGSIFVPIPWLKFIMGFVGIAMMAGGVLWYVGVDKLFNKKLDPVADAEKHKLEMEKLRMELEMSRAKLAVETEKAKIVKLNNELKKTTSQYGDKLPDVLANLGPMFNGNQTKGSDPLSRMSDIVGPPQDYLENSRQMVSKQKSDPLAALGEYIGDEDKRMKQKFNRPINTGFKK